MEKEVKVHPTSIRLTAESERIIAKFMRKHGMNRTAVIEMALRQLDREESSVNNVR